MQLYFMKVAVNVKREHNTINLKVNYKRIDWKIDQMIKTNSTPRAPLCLALTNSLLSQQTLLKHAIKMCVGPR